MKWWGISDALRLISTESYNTGFMSSQECVAVPGTPPCWFPFADWWLCCPWGPPLDFWSHIRASCCHMGSYLTDWHPCWSPSKEKTTQKDGHTEAAIKRFALHLLTAFKQQNSGETLHNVISFFHFLYKHMNDVHMLSRHQANIPYCCQLWLHCAQTPCKQ